jgi:hypothetical protein
MSDETEREPINSEFRSCLKVLLNQHCAENISNTPDHILADYLLACLAGFDAAVNARSSWYGRHDAPGVSTDA